MCLLTPAVYQILNTTKSYSTVIYFVLKLTKGENWLHTVHTAPPPQMCCHTCWSSNRSEWIFSRYSFPAVSCRFFSFFCLFVFCFTFLLSVHGSKINTVPLWAFLVTVPGILNILTSLLTVEVQFTHLLFSPYERRQGIQLPKKEEINICFFYFIKKDVHQYSWFIFYFFHFIVITTVRKNIVMQF